MAQNDWTVVSETPATASSGWEIASEAVTSYKNLEPVGEPVDYSAAATAMEGTPAEPRERTVYSGSVLDRVKLPEPQFDPAEAARLSRREYAERTMRPRERLQYLEPTPEDQITTSAARAAVDTTIGILQGAVSIPKGIVDNIPGNNPLSKFYQAAIDAGERAKSPALRSQVFNRAALLDRVRQNQGELAASRAAFNTMFSPAGADIIAQGAGSLLPTVGMSFIGLGSTSLAAMNALANAGDAAQQAAARLADMPPEQWSNSAIYQDLRQSGMGHRDAVRMLAPIYALPSQAVGGLTGFISGSTGLERALVRGGGSRAGRAATELLGEQAETLTPMVTANATRMLLDDKQKLFEGTGQAAVETAAGATPGAALAAAARPGRPAKPVPTAAQVMAEKGFGAEQWQVASEEPAAPVAPSATVPAPAAPVAATTTTMREQQRAVEDLEAAIEGEPRGIEALEAVQAEAQRQEEPAAAVTPEAPTEAAVKSAEEIAASAIQEEAKPALVEEPPAEQTEIPQQAVVEVPLANLKLSEDVPQFKAGADKAGIVEPLGGKFERTGVAPIQVWRRANGDMEVISGRHRFDLAKRSGEATIPAQIHDESRGFTRDMAAVLDAELNIRDGQGKVKDYVNYFKGTGLDQDTAESRGLLARAPGKRAFTIATKGSDELVTNLRADQIPDEAAYLIALNAPNDARLQGVGIKAVQEGKSAATAVNMMQAVRALAGEADTTTDMFGFDDSAMKEAEEMAKIAGRKQKEIQTRLNAITGAAKNPAVARAEGIDIRDPDAVTQRITQLRQMKSSWDNWSTDPDLIAEIRAERGVPAPALAPVEPSVEADDIDTPEEEASQIKDKSIREKLMRVAKNLGVLVFETGEGFSANQGVINIPAEDKETEGAVSPDHVFAHELGHAILQNRGLSFSGMPKAEVLKWIPNFARFEEISKAYRPAIWNSKIPKVRRHARKNDEIIADVLGAYLLGNATKDDIASLGLTDTDLGEQMSRERLMLTAPSEAELRAQDERQRREAAEAARKEAAPAPEEFVLTGSERAADEAAARGQRELGEEGPVLESIEPVQDNANFRRWFGDSKVVDENGYPLVVYHHTPENFSEFIPGGRDPELSGVAIWMTPETEVSKAPFAHQLYSALRQGRGIDAKGNLISADAVRMLESGRLTEQQAKVIRKRVDEAIDAARVSGVNTMPLYASIKNPLILRGKESSKATLMYPDRVKELKTQGYDGVMAYDDNNALIEVVAFEPNQVKSATGNRGTFGPEADITLDISAARSEAGDTSTRAPSVKRKVRTLNNQRKAGRLTDEQFAEEVDAALEADEAAKYRKPIPERARGADFIRQKLLEAKRRGEISEEAVDFAEWFIRQNERLVDDLGIAIRTPKVQGTAGFYAPFQRIMTLMKETAGDQTAVHEILHHLERMMPADVQQAIRKAWLRSFATGQKKATRDADRLFFALLDNHHFGSGRVSDVDFARAPLILKQLISNQTIDTDQGLSMAVAIEMIRNGSVPHAFYQYVNPSEFWAVNASDIMQGRFDAIRSGVLERLKNWLKEFIERAKDLFGMDSKAPLIRALNSLMKSDGKFVSKRLLGDSDYFLQIGKNIYNQRPLVDWTMPDETKLDDFIYKIQNKQIDLKRATQDIEKSAGQLEDRWNPYLQEELYHGRTARATANFLREEVRPLLQAMQKEGVSIGELETYLHNRHAEERNEQIARVNDLMPDGGSGIMTQDARDYLAALSPEQKAKYERLAKMVDGITQGTRDYLIESGLEEEATVRQWEKTYGNYVPLNREDVEYSTAVGAGTGRGFSVRGPASRRATGSERAVVDILPNIIMQRERAIVRGEKNRVAVALYGLAIQNPNPKVWLAVNPEAMQSRKRTIQELIDMGLTAQDAEGLMQEPAQNVVDPNTGLVTQRVNPVLRGANNVLAARVNGKDRYVFFNTVNPRASRMVMSLLNMDADQLGTALTMIARATRYMSNINTQYNPIFGPYNFLRDVQGAAIQLDGTPIEDKRAEVLSPVNVAGAMKGIYQALRAERKEQPIKGTDWSKLWLEFQKEGGQTGYRDMFSRSQERADSLQKELDRLNEGPVKKTALATPRWILDWLSDYNETLENAVRLSAYKAALDTGLTKEQAASVAKNLTVNFNRKGQVGVQAGAWYSFFNSAVQGTSRMLSTLAKMERPGDLKSIRLQPIGKVVIYGGLTLGAAQALTLAAMGYDENEPPDFVKDRNVIIPIGDGKYLAWPLPLGYHVIPAIGRILTEWAISGGKDTSKRVAHLTSLIFDAFNPIGNAGWSFQSVAPTIFDPMVALFENRDWTGKRIAKEDFNKLDPTPGYTRAKENASRIGKEISYYLNLMSGGDKDVKGVISPTPDQIDYLIGQAFGGLGREVLKVAKTAEATVTGEELAPYNIPLAGRFYGNTKASYAESNKFYQNIEKLNTLENQIQGRQKRGESTADFVKENPEVRLIAASNQIERNISALRKRKEKLIKDGAPRASVRAVENQITAQMKKLNEKMDELEKQKR